MARRRDELAAPDLAAGVEALRSRVARLLEEPPAISQHKALLSVDGGLCPSDGRTLVFDPWSPVEHRCPACGGVYRGERHDRAWARWHHLWLAERTGDLAALAVLTDDETARTRAAEILSWYGTHYRDFPNADNVLGPARVLFSTYLESIWLDNLMAAAFLLGEAGALDESTGAAVSDLADQAAHIIGEYDERLSNRQLWNNAALLSVAVWFEDEALAHRGIEETSGVIAQLLHGFGADGLWYEGENYHFFALQGLLRGAGWARLAGVDLFQEPELADPIRRVLLSARATALPDLTHPARKDSRFGVSLAQPMFLESWEIGLARCAGSPDGIPYGLSDWVATLHQHPAGKAERFDSYLYEEAIPPTAPRTRSDLSWRALMEMAPELPAAEPDYALKSVYLASHDLAVIRSDQCYVSMECGELGGGHGHPDRLSITAHVNGVHWLPDPGTGSYVSSDLHYFRSTIAHNAPLVDGRSKIPGETWCEAFDTKGDCGWIRGHYAGLRRTLVTDAHHLLDIVESSSEEPHVLEIPWHFNGRIEVTSPGTWQPESLDHPGTTGHRRFVPQSPGPVGVRVTNQASFVSFQCDGGELWSMVGPGLPPEGQPAEFLVVRASGAHVRCVSVMAWDSEVRLDPPLGDTIRVSIGSRPVVHTEQARGWVVEDGSDVRLEGHRAAPRSRPLATSGVHHTAEGSASWRTTSPVAAEEDDGFADIVPLHLDHEDQYRRSEAAYQGPGTFSAQAYPGWDHEAFFLAVDVGKHNLVFREPGAEPLELDNDPDDIHSDGVQVHLASPNGAFQFAVIAVPDPASDRLQLRLITGEGKCTGRWRPIANGYRVELALSPSWWEEVIQGDRIGFDLLVNEAAANRQRRIGQLVWSGGGGWVWLRGDRHPREAFGRLVLQ